MSTKDNTKDIAELLPEAISKNLSPESMSALKEEFERLVESKVAERLAIATAAAEASLDEEVNKQTTELIHKIEEAHKIGLEKVVTHLNEKHDANIAKVRNYYKNQLGREALKFKDALVESISKYIDARIDKLVPYAEVKAAVKNDSAMRVLESFKNILDVNEASGNIAIRSAIMEGHQMLQDAQNAAQKAISEKEIAEKQLNEMAESYAFERNLAQLDEDQKNFMIRMAKKAGVGYVNENMSYINSLYEKKVINERRELAAKEMNNQKRNKLQNISRKTLVEKTSSPRQTMLMEDRNLSDLIDQIESDWKD
jgi:hypothetical protein